MNLNNKNRYSQKEIVDTEFFRDIPVEEVAELLGIDVNSKGWFNCPSHNDTKPSAQIRYKTNRWCCYACGDGKAKSCIDLVMQTQGLNFWDSIKYLDQYHPGGITIINKEEVEEDELKIPFIEKEFLKEIGLKSNPFTQITVKCNTNIDNDGTPIKETKKYILETEEAATLILDKILEYRTKQKAYASKIVNDFPELDNQAIEYIWTITDAKIEKTNVYLSELREFIYQLHIKQPPLSLEDEEHDIA